MTPARSISGHALAGLARERTVVLVAALFVALVLVSAWLGWSATSTVNDIYAQAAAFLKDAGQPVPPNPVTEGSSLALLRNLSVYVSLIGAFAAIVIGTRLIEADRRAGVLPLVASRPLDRLTYANGKIAALTIATGGLAGLAALVSAAALLVLPSVHVAPGEWLRFAAFFALAWGYMLSFGLIALGVTARLSAPAAGLLAATVAWLAVTFVMPALTGNVTPTAAINPVSALAAAPDTGLFHAFGDLFGPLSLAESFKFLSAELLGYLPAGIGPRGVVPPLVDLAAALGLSGAFALAGCLALDPTTGGPDA